MARRVYLHVGLPKTGTTFLQTMMWHNRSLLRDRGFLYPGQQRLEHYNAFQQVRRQRPGRGAPADAAWDRLRDELAGWDGVGLISHEFFSMATRAMVARVVEDLAPAEVHVVVTVRSYLRQFPAVWQEALKMKVDSSFDEFMDDLFAERLTGAWSWESQDAPAVLRRWSTAVPADRVHVITVPPPGSPRDLLWRRWCTALEIDDAGFDLQVSYPNESLGAQQAALLRRVKAHLPVSLHPGAVRHRWVRRYLGHEVLVPQGGDRFTPRDRYHSQLMRRARKTVQVIEAGQFRVTGDLDDLLDPGPASSGPHPDDVTTEQMLDVAARAIGQMVDDVREMTAERDRWRARAVARRRTRLKRIADRLRRRARPDARHEDDQEEEDDA